MTSYFIALSRWSLLAPLVNFWRLVRGGRYVVTAAIEIVRFRVTVRFQEWHTQNVRQLARRRGLINAAQVGDKRDKVATPASPVAKSFQTPER